MDLAGFLDALEVRLHVLLEARMGPSALLDESDAIADSKAILEEERATDALQLALHHDANAVAKHVRLVHVVRRQNDNAVFFVGLEHIPEVAPRTQIHASGGLIEHDELGAAAESHTNRCLALVATGERRDHFVLINVKADIFDQGIDFTLLVSGVTTFEIVENVKVLARGQQVKKYVMLRAHTHELAHLVHLLEQINVVALGIALRLLDEAGQHGDDGGLAGAIMAQHGEDLAVKHLDADATDRTEAAREGLLEVVNFKVVSLGLQLLANLWWSFVVLIRHLCAFKLVIVLPIQEGLIVASFDLARSASLAPAAPVVAGHAQETRVEPLTEIRRDNLVKVEANGGENDEVEEQHPEGRDK